MSTEKEIRGIETRSFDYVPEDERHGRPSQLFYMWFGISATIFSLVTGYVGVSLGLSFWWAMLAIVIGNLLGAFFMALHAAQGPQLGIPQMIQSRAQFGYFGAMFPIAITWVMYIAFLAVDIVLAGQGFQDVFPWSLNAWMAVLTIPMLLLAVFGYDLINRFQKYQTLVFILLFVALTIVWAANGVPHGSLSRGGFQIGNFLLAMSIVAAYQITYAPYVSDYTRYLKKNATRKAFSITYAATVISCIWLMGLGAAIGAVSPHLTDMLSEVKAMCGSLGGVVTILLAVGLIAPNSTNVYGGMMTTLSLANNVNEKLKSTAGLRSAVAVVIAVLGVLVATVGAGSFYTNLENYLTFILYILIPWSIINLTDYYLVRHGDYRTADFYTKDGRFGKVNIPVMIIYLVAFGIEVPFMNTTVYEGPIAKALNGGDIAWIVGAIVTIPLYLIGRRFGVSTTATGGAETASGATDATEVVAR
jgi:nucleobase:cation symporter-1, NCS1 family